MIQGTRVEDFDVEVLAVLKGDVPDGDMILVRLGGDLIKKTGGLAAGMSGSPVYLSGKLAGALSYGYEFSDHNIALVTPAERMMKIFDFQERARGKVYTLGDGASGSKSYLREGYVPPVPVRGTPIVTPVMVQGISGRALARLEKGLSNSMPSNMVNLRFIQSGGSGGGPGQDMAGKSPALLPGSAIGVQLMRGDASVTAIGTVTYVRGDEFLAFGHPFLAKGDVGLYATAAYIHHVVTGLSMPFKVGSPGMPVGIISQDRMSGILGRLGVEPRAIPVSVTVRDKDTGVTRTFRAQVVDDEDISSELVGAFVLQAFDTTLNRIGAGTCKLEVTLLLDGLKDPVRRENMYFSERDISAVSLDEVHELVDTLHRNEFRDVTFKSISLVSEMEKGQRRAIIREARAKEERVLPGGTVHIEVTFQPYRAPAETRSIEVKIPEDTPPGTLYLTVRGGNALLVQNSDNNGDQPAPEPRETHKDLDDLIQSLVARERNSDIVVEYYPPSAGEDTPEGPHKTAPEVPGAGVPVAGVSVARVPRARVPVAQLGPVAPREETQRPSPARYEGASEGLKKFTFPSEYVMDGSCEVEVTVEKP
ncbi:MAG TPA: hypothetical protein GX506_03225 [Firmicutes bacterium]|nr:hypothetical protein [Bacillota bacterium]